MAITKVTRELLSTGIDDNSNATAITIDSSENVGIGNTSPTEKLTLGTTSDANTRIAIQSANDGAGTIQFADGTSAAAYAGYINYTHSDNVLAFATSSTERMRIDSTGAVTMPNQPAFLAKTASTMNNLTVGQNTTVTFGTEIFDQNADFASNTFTAPVTGRYQLNTTLYMTDLDIDTAYYQLALITSNRTFYHILESSSFASDASYQSIDLSILCDMDASDTAYVQMQIANSGANQADVTVHSYFSGYLVA